VAERKKPAVSFSAQDWQRLRGALEQDESVEGAVLLVMVSTGIRIGDVLRVERAALKSALFGSSGLLEVVQKGGSRRMMPVAGAEDAWLRLREVCDRSAKQSGVSPSEIRTVAEAVCPASRWGATGGGGAYQRVNRHLRALAEQLQLQGRPHLHRMRRTVATNALALTKDVHLVSHLLGHKSVRTTERYVDEVREVEVAELQRRLRE
jgi:integrase